MNTFKSVGKQEMEKLVKESLSISQIFQRLELSISSDAYQIFYKEMELMKIDISHLKCKKRVKRTKTEEELTTDSNSNNILVKKYILNNNLIEYKCQCCNLQPIWNNTTLVLQLDHINGINNDNRLENLRFLCPNCHSQTHTFSGRKKEIKSTNNLALISKEELQELVNTKKLQELSKIFNVIILLIKQRCKELNVNIPENGYWSEVIPLEASFIENVKELQIKGESQRAIARKLQSTRYMVIRALNFIETNNRLFA